MSITIVFTKTEIDQLYYFSIKCRNNYISPEELMTTFINLCDDLFINVASSLAIIVAIIIMTNNADSFQSNVEAVVLFYL